MEISPSQQYPTYPVSESHCAASLSQHQGRYWEAMDSRKLHVEFLCTYNIEDPERKADEWARRQVHKCWNTCTFAESPWGSRGSPGAVRVAWWQMGTRRKDLKSRIREVVCWLEWTQLQQRIGLSRMKLLRTESLADIGRCRRCRPGWWRWEYPEHLFRSWDIRERSFPLAATPVATV